MVFQNLNVDACSLFDWDTYMMNKNRLKFFLVVTKNTLALTLT